MVGIKPPPLEELVGMEVYLSQREGIGGILKQVPEDFEVEEIMEDGRVLELGKDLGLELGERKEYLHFTLEKRNWDSMRALKVLSDRLHVGKKRFGFAGTKDKRAVSTQRVSVWGIAAEQLLAVRMKDVAIRDPVYSSERITLGCLSGNRFTITVRGLDCSDAEERIASIIAELHGRIPNFFGLQRFGVARPITHLVGREILRKDFSRAVMIYLADAGSESEDSQAARKFLSETLDFKEAAKKFPKHLGYEKAMLDHLAATPTDFIGAMRKLPKKLRWMFIHAYQGYVFNLALSEYIRRGDAPDALPLAGHEIELDEVTSKVLDEKGVRREDFKVAEMPEMSSEGIMRECFVPLQDAQVLSSAEDDMFPGKKKTVVRFTLSKGSYATSAMRELMKNDYWKTA